MELDPRTLIVASLVSAGLFGVISIAFARLQDTTRFIGAWGAGMLVLSVGLLGLALRDVLPGWLSIGMANALVVAGLALALRSLRRFLGRDPGDRANGAIVVALLIVLLVFSEVWSSIALRILAISAAVLYLSVAAAWLLRRRAPAECRRSAGFTEFAFWAVAAITVVRGLVTLVAPPADSLLTPNAMNAIAFLSFTAFIIAATLGVMWMEIESLQAELVRSARYDALTGVPNRGTFLAEFAREASRCARGAAAFSLALFDLDDFKRLNDRHGHLFGDLVLKAFAEVLYAGIRRHDTVGRYGGEEFSVLMPATEKETALGVAERVRRDLETRGITVGERRVEVTVSGGVSTYGADGKDWDSLLSAADTALYAAKEGGRNRIVAAGA